MVKTEDFFFFLVVSLLCESNKTHFTHYILVRDNGWRMGVLVWCELKMAKDVSHLCQEIGLVAFMFLFKL